MKQILSTLLAIAFILPACFAQEAETVLVRATFEQYKTAILNDKGEEAVAQLDSRTIGYYSGMLEHARHSDSSAVDQLSILDKLMVFSIRHRATKAEIMSFTGESFIVFAIKNGMIGKSSVANNEIGEVMIDHDTAKGQFVSRGQKAPYYYNFYKENGAWKLDLTSLFEGSTIAFKSLIEGSGKTENEYLFMLLELITQKAPGAEIWKPVE